MCWGLAGLRLVTGTLGARLGQAQSLTICSTSDEPRAGVAGQWLFPTPAVFAAPEACCALTRVPLPEAHADPALLCTASGHALQALNQPTPGASGSSDCLKWASRGWASL